MSQSSQQTAAMQRGDGGVPPAKASRVAATDMLFEAVLDGNNYNAACNVMVGDKRPPALSEATSVANSSRLPRSAAVRDRVNRTCLFGNDDPAMRLGQSGKRATYSLETSVSLCSADCHSVTSPGLWGANRYLLRCPVERLVFHMRDRNFNCGASLDFHRPYIELYGVAQGALFQFGQRTSEHHPYLNSRYQGHREVIFNHDRPESFTPAAKLLIGQTIFVLVGTNQAQRKIMMNEGNFTKYISGDFYNVRTAAVSEVGSVIRHNSKRLFGCEPDLNLGQVCPNPCERRLAGCSSYMRIVPSAGRVCPPCPVQACEQGNGETRVWKPQHRHGLPPVVPVGGCVPSCCS